MKKTVLPRSRQALLLIDFMNPLDFPGAEDLIPGALEAAAVTAKLARSLRKRGVPVIYANDNFGSWQSDFASMVLDLKGGGGASARIVQLLKPRKDDLTVLKPMHSAPTPTSHC